MYIGASDRRHAHAQAADDPRPDQTVENRAARPSNRAQRKKNAAETISTGLRPKRSLSTPGHGRAEDAAHQGRTDEPAHFELAQQNCASTNSDRARDHGRVEAEQQPADRGHQAYSGQIERAAASRPHRVGRRSRETSAHVGH